MPRKQSVRNTKPGRNVVLYRTTKTIDNPIGDGRYERDKDNTTLFGRKIPAGFVFAFDEEGNIEDRSRPYDVIQHNRAGASELRAALLKVAAETSLKPPPPEVPEVPEGITEAEIKVILQNKEVAEVLRKLLDAQNATKPKEDPPSTPPRPA